ncbi:MAG: arabinan endo-1,5-alpha-L-arabinosidase [Gemmatimonadota bacterium]
MRRLKGSWGMGLHARHWAAVLVSQLSLVVPRDELSAQHLEVRAHDPVMIRAGDRFYLFSTGRGVSVWSSPDMKTWESLAPVHASAPAWTESVVPGFSTRNHLWAPDVVHRNGTYYLYYSVSAFGRNTSAIGVATNRTLNPADPAFRWVDRGMVVQSVPGRDQWNAIDPNGIVDDKGTPWLTFGSFWMGIKLVKLDSTMTRVAEPQVWRTIAARPRAFPTADANAGSGVIEAPFLFRKGGFYYLFVSLGVCCRGAQSTYHIAVGRSAEITGPYLDRDGKDLAHGGGTVVLRGNEKYAGIGHSGTYTFDGNDYLIAHAYDAADQGRYKLMIRPLHWESGWPLVSLEN